MATTEPIDGDPRAVKAPKVDPNEKSEQVGGDVRAAVEPLTIRQAFEESWRRHEAAYRYLGR